MTKTAEDMIKLLPLNIAKGYSLKDKTPGLVIIDEVKGFCTLGNLAPPSPDPVINNMISRTNDLAKLWGDRPIMAFLDTHAPEKPEYPYPPHCIACSGEENLVEELSWMEQDLEQFTSIRKDCINGIIGSIGEGRIRFLDWVNELRLDTLVVVGICTDICVMQFVQAVLSCRNHGLLPTLVNVVIYTEACATYDLPGEVAAELGLPDTAAHPRDLTQHLGLYMMQQSGAILTEKIIF
jgi:nicotinamidase-related amidase